MQREYQSLKIPLQSSYRQRAQGNAKLRKRQGVWELDDILRHYKEGHHVHIKINPLLLTIKGFNTGDTSFETGNGLGDFETRGQ